jgi:hypothetical protein
VPIIWKSGILKLLEASGIVQGCNGIALTFTRSKKAVLHTVRVEGDNITASYVSINCMMMGCMESNWMTETEQQMEKNSF